MDGTIDKVSDSLRAQVKRVVSAQEVQGMLEIIDLSQEIFTGMPVFPGMPEVSITMHVSHEEWEGIVDREIVSPAVNRLELGEHTGTHQPHGASVSRTVH
jgi:hypothetical protein